ncbi:MAG: hypothetical protein WAK55_32515, partial [Xanthobacteraceae bacterium]
LLGQLLNFLSVMRAISLVELITQISHFAKCLDLMLVAANDFEGRVCADTTTRYDAVKSGSTKRRKLLKSQSP